MKASTNSAGLRRSASARSMGEARSLAPVPQASAMR